MPDVLTEAEKAIMETHVDFASVTTWDNISPLSDAEKRVQVAVCLERVEMARYRMKLAELQDCIEDVEAAHTDMVEAEVEIWLLEKFQ